MYKRYKKTICGYIRIRITGDLPERFLQKISEANIPLYAVEKKSRTCCIAMIRLKDLQNVRKLRYRTDYQLQLKDRFGFAFVLRKLMKNKPLLLSLVCSFLLLIYLSSTIWTITVNHASIETKERILTYLRANGVYRGASKQKVLNLTELQDRLMKDIPEIALVQINRSGSVLRLSIIEKEEKPEPTMKGPRHIVAGKSGVITETYIEKGEPQIAIHDFVKKGDLLVSGKMKMIKDGVMNSSKDLMHESDENEKFIYEQAEGEIRAKTWYHMNVVVPLKTTQAVLTGQEHKRQYLQIHSIRLPIWGFHNQSYEASQTDFEVNQLKIMNKSTPFSFIQARTYEKENKVIERTSEVAKELGIQEAKETLQRRLGRDANILTVKVLHEVIERGKVNLTLYITVNENIVEYEQIDSR